MKRYPRSGISNTIFAGTVAVLVVVAIAGFGLYAVALTHTSSTTEMMTTSTESMTTSAMANATNSYAFTPHSGAMVNNAWLLVGEVGMHEYAISVHAEGLESNGTYILEGALTSGSMQTVPISSQSMTMNETGASEFQTNLNGTGTYWIVLDSNPVSTFENIQLFYIPQGMMQDASLVATVSFTMMNETSTMTH